MDFSRYAASGRYYSGVERKKGILIGGEAYIVKFAKDSPEGMTFSHVSEYLGSHLFAHAGLKTQKTMLGICDGHPVVVMKDFLEPGESFVPFNEIGDSSMEKDRERYQYSYADIMTMLKENRKLTDVQETCGCFWEMYLIDAWIGNFDRHGANWGFVKRENKYRLAPVYDNGSSLFPRLNTDEKLKTVMDHAEEMERRIYQFPASQILLHGKKSSYYEVINSLAYEACNEALYRIHSRIDMEWVDGFVDNLTEVSSVRRQFYREMLRLRYEKLIEEPYWKLAGK